MRPRFAAGFVVLRDSWEQRPERQALDRTMEKAFVFSFFHELRFQLHRTETVDFAIDVVVTVDQAYAFDLGADLDHARQTLDLEILDHGHGIAVAQHITHSIANDFFAIGRFSLGIFGPLMRTFGIDIQSTVSVSQSGLALRTGRQVGNEFLGC